MYGLKEEKEKKEAVFLFHAQVSSKARSCFVCGPIELKFGGDVHDTRGYHLNGEDQILSSVTVVRTREQ